MSCSCACELIFLWRKLLVHPAVRLEQGQPGDPMRLRGVGGEAPDHIRHLLHSAGCLRRSQLHPPPSSEKQPWEGHPSLAQLSSGGPRLFCLVSHEHEALCCSDVRPPAPELCMATGVGQPACPKATVAGGGTSWSRPPVLFVLSPPPLHLATSKPKPHAHQFETHLPLHPLPHLSPCIVPRG